MKSFTYAPNPFQKMPKGSKKLPVANAIYVVNRDKEDKKISQTEFKKRVKQVEDKFLYLFGGFTNDKICHGEFVSKTKNRILAEEVARIFSFTKISTFKEHRKDLEKWLVQKKKEWNQESIAYEFEGDLYYI